MNERPRHRGLATVMALAALIGAAAPPPEMLGVRKPEIHDTRRRHKPPRRVWGWFISWEKLKARGWTEDGRGDRINPKRSRRRRWAAEFLNITGKRLTGRQYKRLLRGKLPPRREAIIT